MATFILSYPGEKDFPAGGSPRGALSDWLHLCDAITRAGGRILVLDPPQGRFSGPYRAARLGALFRSTFLLSQQQDDSGEITAFLTRAGLQVERAALAWGGQADVISLERNRYLLTYPQGLAEALQGAAQVRRHLPDGARVLEIALHEGFPTGDSCLCPIASPGGDHVLLVHPPALLSHTPAEISRFAGGDLEVLPVSAEDAAARACTGFDVRGTLLLPAGLSVTLRGLLSHRGFPLVELDLPELLPLAGGLRSLVNHLPGYILSEDAPSYALRREELHRLLSRVADAPAATC